MFNKIMSLFSFYIIIFITIINEVQNIQRNKRTLIFPPTAPTRAQLIYGIGIPLQLEMESMTTGYVLKAEYFLPTLAEEVRPTQLNPQLINKRNAHNIAYNDLNDTIIYDTDDSIRNKKFVQNSKQIDQEQQERLSKYRWLIYKVIETIVDRLGFPGRECVLRGICEAAEIPFHYENGLFGEILHIIMTPSTSNDVYGDNSAGYYFYAESIGKSSGVSCENVFRKCKLSLLQKFSIISHII